MFSSTWVAEARKDKGFKGKLPVLCGFPSGGRCYNRSYSAFDTGDFTKKTVASSRGFPTDFYQGAITSHFPGGVFCISGLLARI